MNFDYVDYVFRLGWPRVPIGLTNNSDKIDQLIDLYANPRTVSQPFFLYWQQKIKILSLTPNNSRYRTLNECNSIKKRIKLKYMFIEDSLSNY